MRVGLYLRVSTDAQTERYGLPAQRRTLTEHCERQGWEYEIYEDAGISGETLDARPAMLRLLEDAREGRVQAALAVEMERFSRSESLFDWLVIKQAFREGRVKFGTPAQLFDPADTEDDFLTDLFGALSKREKRKIIQRTLRGKIEASRQGRYISARLPYGYRRHGRGTLVVHEEEARVVREIYGLSSEGSGIRTIARILTDGGIPAPRRRRREWWWSTVQGILTNKSYIGQAFYNQSQRRGNVVLPRPESEWVRIQIPRIVSDDVFRQAQARLGQNKLLSPRNQRYQYLLKGLVRCALCGRTMGGVPFHGVTFYRCRGKDRLLSDPPCANRSIAAAPLEGLVWEQLVTLLREPKLILAEAKLWREGRVSDRDETMMRLASVENSLQEMPLQRERVLAAYREGWATPDEAKAQLAEIDRKRDGLDAERRTLDSRLTGHTASEEQAKRMEDIVEKVGRRLDRLDFEQRFHLVHAFIERVLVGPDGGVELHAFVPMKEPLGYDRYVTT